MTGAITGIERRLRALGDSREQANRRIALSLKNGTIDELVCDIERRERERESRGGQA